MSFIDDEWGPGDEQDCGGGPPVIWLEASLAALDDVEDLALARPGQEGYGAVGRFIAGHSSEPGGAMRAYPHVQDALVSIAARALIARCTTGDPDDDDSNPSGWIADWVAQERAGIEEQLLVTRLEAGLSPPDGGAPRPG
jgi:hypothetical protein